MSSNQWAESTVAGAGVETAPEITWTGATSGKPNGFEVIAAANTSGGLDYWWTSGGSVPQWTAETVARATTRTTYATPSITATSTSVDLADIALGPGNIDNWSQPFGTIFWNKELVARG